MVSGQVHGVRNKAGIRTSTWCEEQGRRVCRIGGRSYCFFSHLDFYSRLYTNETGESSYSNVLNHGPWTDLRADSGELDHMIKKKKNAIH